MPILIVGVAVLVTLLVLGAGIYFMRRERQSEVDDRLERFTTEYGSQLSEALAEDDAHASAREVVSDVMDKAIEDRGFAKKWRVQLGRADLKLTPSEFLLMHPVSVVVFFLAGYFVIFRGNVVMSILAGVVGFFFPRFYLSHRTGKRYNTFVEQLPDNLQMWVNGLRAGYSVLQAVDAISREAPEPTSSEFARVVKENQLGIPLEDAFARLLERMPSEDLDLVITAVNIQRQVGGNLAEILETISSTIRERIKLKGEIRVLTAQGRVTGYIIGGLPILLLIFLMIVNPEYAGQLFSEKCGWLMLGCGGTMIAMGMAVIQKIITIEI